LKRKGVIRKRTGLQIRGREYFFLLPAFELKMTAKLE
jgi:hypothetical protein